MKEVILYGISTGVAFIGFIGLLLTGLVRKRKRIILSSFLVLLLAVGLGITTGYKVVTKSYKKIAGIVGPRSGEEIYNALFGAASNECLEILNYQDQVVPKVDYAIWLHFKTCPEECSRILSEFDYSRTQLGPGNRDLGIPSDVNIDWWNPRGLGDTLFVYEYEIRQGKNTRTLWVSMDSTEVYCRDILD